MRPIILALFFTIIQSASPFMVSRYLEPNGGKPGDICGVLSAWILNLSGVTQVDPHDFWFLQPWDEYTIETILEPAFPKDEFLWFRTEEPINEFDFEQFPLRLNDFIFIYDVTWRDTFSHMLVITRVEDGSVYSITNFQNSEGWHISEVLLYDGEGNGLFYEWADMSNYWTTGTTGFSGFSLWRKK